MDELAVSTTVYLPPAEVFEFLIDFPRYTNYSKYLKRVRQHGDGGPGTDYRLRFEWWKVSYTAHSRVTAVERPTRIDFELVRGITAEGTWMLEPAPEAAPDGKSDATHVTLRVRYRPETVTGDAVDLPRLVSLSWVVERVKPLIKREAERVVERIVADIEGQRRAVDLTIET
ncbi:MAG: SRPBCC family protein [Halobacteriales archaeon]|nr:SRPBCC family protein [Halobacteriales archaeon]